jgi:quercetin dioxygenase-like cupin family protein
VREIRAGDTVWVPPGEKHRHGATPDNSIERIAMQKQHAGTEGRRAREMARSGGRRAIWRKTGRLNRLE